MTSSQSFRVALVGCGRISENHFSAIAKLDGLEARLAAHDRPAPDLAGYDQLIGGAR